MERQALSTRGSDTGGWSSEQEGKSGSASGVCLECPAGAVKSWHAEKGTSNGKEQRYEVQRLHRAGSAPGCGAATAAQQGLRVRICERPAGGLEMPHTARLTLRRDAPDAPRGEAGRLTSAPKVSSHGRPPGQPGSGRHGVPVAQGGPAKAWGSSGLPCPPRPSLRPALLSLYLPIIVPLFYFQPSALFLKGNSWASGVTEEIFF